MVIQLASNCARPFNHVCTRVIAAIAAEEAEAEADAHNSPPGFVAGAKVEVRYNGKNKFYPGVISRVNADDTYDITYNDGDKESNAKPEFIRLPFAVHDKIKARYGGKKKYFGGVISSVNEDSTYDITYNDGDKESKVKPEFVMAEPGGEAATSNGSGGQVASAQKAKAETAKAGGKKEHFVGEISCVIGGDANDITNNDGDGYFRLEECYQYELIPEVSLCCFPLHHVH